MDFILDYSKWICGNPDLNNNLENCNGNGTTSLENEKGYMCCLGQFCKQLKPDLDILGYSTPEEINEVIPYLSYLSLDNNDFKNYIYDTDFSSKAIYINDNQETSVEEKIKLLTKLCLEYNHTLTVINKK